MKITALIAVLLLASSARAIELSLEENRGERGSVGYVDMQRLFTNSPDAQRAKESFEDLVRQAEERVNLRKAELLKLRQQLDETRVERDALAHSMSLAPAPSSAAAAAPEPAPAAPAPAAAAPAPAAAPPALSPEAAALLSASTAAAPGTVPSASHARELALPGMATTEAAPTAPPAAAAKGVPSSDGAAAVPPAVSSAAAKPGVPSSDGAAAAPAPAKSAVPAVSTAAASAAGLFPAAPAPAPVARLPAGPTPAQRLLELDAKIISLQADIARKESDLTQEHDDADRGLLDVESRKTDQVLARLYRAMSEVARREGVSVVIDKTSILYGHPAVDLTDKVLKYLKENSKEAATP